MEFWELADNALKASGSLTVWGSRIKDLTSAMREEQRRLVQVRHAGRLSRLLRQPGADDTQVAEPAVSVSAIATPAVNSCPHCHQPVMLVTQIAAPPAVGNRRRSAKDPRSD